jgi:hypothetical protein
MDIYIRESITINMNTNKRRGTWRAGESLINFSNVLIQVTQISG